MSIEILKEIRLLYVEDDESIRKILARGLKRRVKELEIAVNGEDGYQKFLSFKPDIIVTDIKMPILNGLDMSKKIRETSMIPIIITSAHGESNTLIEAIESGINGYILKPINKDILIDTIITHSKSIVLERELKKKEKLLSQQLKNAALGEMISNIAHQWRQPLSVISTISSGMKIQKECGMLEDDDFFINIEKITDTTQHLSKTIDYFKDFLDDSSQKKIFNIKEEIAKCLIINEATIQNNKIKIIQNYKDDITINNLSNIFLQAIINILNNSIDILKNNDLDNRYIFIDISKNNDKVIISIKDNGGGINEDIISNVFEPYSTTKHKSDGTGLGLYITYNNITQKMGGSICVKNTEYEYKDKLFMGAEFDIEI